MKSSIWKILLHANRLVNMKNKIICITVILSAFFEIANGQDNKLKGTVYNESQQALEGATVKIILSDSSEYISTATNVSGIFELSTPKNRSFSVMVGYFGYESFVRKFKGMENKNELFLGRVTLKSKPQNLQQVTVTGNRQLFNKTADKLVINIGNSILGSAGNATEVLERIPGVSLDRQNNNIKVNGRDGVSIMINGKLKKVPQDALLKMLESINGGNIQKIELINSSASEDAEGNGGLINIVMNKAVHDEIRGSYNLNVGIGKYEKSSIGGEFGYSGTKLDVYGSASFGWNRAFADFGNDREILSNGVITRGASNYAVRKSKNLLGNIDLSLDYKLFEKTKFGFGVFSSLNRVKVNENGNTRFYDIKAGESFSNIYHHEINKWTQFGSNFNVSHAFNDRVELVINFDYLRYDNRNPHDYKFENYENSQDELTNSSESKVSKLTPIDFFIYRADFKKKINERNAFSFGIKHTSSKLSNSINVLAKAQNNDWEKVPDLSQNVKMKEEISAGYLDYKFSTENGLKANMGFRYEYTQSILRNDQNVKLVDRNLGKLFPSLSLSKDFDSNTLSLSYNRRISRPTFSYLAPYVHFVDEMTFITGNMELNSSISNNYEVTYQYKKKYIATLGYSSADNPIIPYQIQIDPESNKQIIRAENLKKSNLISLGFSIPFQFNRWWDSYTSLNGFYGRNEAIYQNGIIENEKMYVSINMNHSFKILKNLTAELSGMYQSRSPFGMAYLLPFGKVSTGAKYSLKNENGTIRITVDDLFWNMNFGIDNPQSGLGFNQSFKGKFSEPRLVRITYSKNLGGGMKKTKRNDSAEEEKARAGS